MKTIDSLIAEREDADNRAELLRATLVAIVEDAWLCADGNYLVDAKFIEAAEGII